MNEELRRMAEYIEDHAGFTPPLEPTVADPSIAVCHFCGLADANIIVGRGDVPGVAAHLQCWLDEPEVEQ